MTKNTAAERANDLEWYNFECITGQDGVTRLARHEFEEVPKGDYYGRIDSQLFEREQWGDVLSEAVTAGPVKVKVGSRVYPLARFLKLDL